MADFGEYIGDLAGFVGWRSVPTYSVFVVNGFLEAGGQALGKHVSKRHGFRADLVVLLPLGRTDWGRFGALERCWPGGG